MSNERLYQILLSPRVTEKTTLIGQNSNQYGFHVVPDARKAEVNALGSVFVKRFVNGVPVVDRKSVV